MFRLLGSVLALAALLVACADAPPPSTGHLHGEPIEPGERPSADECQQRLRSDHVAAKRIRESLRIDGIGTTEADISAAAADPASDTTTLGVPLTGLEQAALRASGYAMDDASAMSYWVSVGMPERFGGTWIDPPGSTRYVVAVVGGDPDTLALARCLEGPDVRYVWASISLAAGEALKDRIGADMQALRASGVEVNTVDFDELRGIVTVGVTHVNPGLLEQFVERYGQPIEVIEQGPITPL